MKKFLLVMAVLFGAFTLAREWGHRVKFNRAEGALQVERLGKGGAVVHEAFNPRLAPYLALYHGAGWCGPCQRFSPTLEAFYHGADKSGRMFQLVMVNYDESEADMLAYMREHSMEFPSVLKKDAGAWAAATGNGIPNLIIVDTATGKVVTSSFDGSSYEGCEKPLKVLRTILAQGHPEALAIVARAIALPQKPAMLGDHG